MSVKNLIRTTLNKLHLDLTQNLKYDRLTQKIISKVVTPSSTCIDVGCHKGEIFDLFLKYAPKGGHYAFEPIPDFFKELKGKYSNNNTVLPYALSDKDGTSTFQYVKNAPAYSGLKNRKYDTENPIIEELTIEIKTLDNIIPEGTKIDLIKIDVEGAELGVLKGGLRTLKANKPVIIFECGLGASDYYGTKPEEIYAIITKEIGLKISLLENWLKNKATLSEEEFINHFNKNSEYYFIAHL